MYPAGEENEEDDKIDKFLTKISHYLNQEEHNAIRSICPGCLPS